LTQQGPIHDPGLYPDPDLTKMVQVGENHLKIHHDVHDPVAVNTGT
jgi:hypothetical protein